MNDKKICRSCLSSNRKMISLKLIQHLILIANLDLQTGWICWECHSFLKKYFLFKNQVRIAKEYFNNFVKTNYQPKSLSKLTCTKKLLYDAQYTHSKDPLILHYNDNELTGLRENIKKKEIELLTTDLEVSNDNSNDNEEHLPFFEKTEMEQCHVKQEKLEKTVIQTTDLEVNDDKSNDNNSIEKHLAFFEKAEIEQCYVKKEKAEKTVLQTTDLEVNDVKSNDIEKHLKLFKMTEIQQCYVKLENPEQNVVKIALKSVDGSEDNEEDLQDKFSLVLLSEEEIERRREKKRNHPNYKKMPLKCDNCVLGFKMKSIFEAHLAKMHDKNLGDFQCSICDCRFTSYKLAGQHKKRHYQLYKCNICSYEIREMAAMVAHCKSKHKGDTAGRVHCKDCDNVFNRCHSLKRQFACEVCNKRFPLRSRWESHVFKHGGERARQLAYCNICQVQYKNLSGYRNHLLNTTLHPQNTYECSECHKRFSSRTYFRRHFDFFHLNKSKHKCEDCNKLFITDFKLKSHRQVQHGDGPQRSRDHKCERCGKMFYDAKILKAHQLTHSSVRSFMCSECGDTFKQMSALYTHVKLVHKRLKRPVKRKQ